ncbi:antitoxin Xre/MbcA/ParS toxin-binding domain-containing protein [Rhodococcus sp. Q]|uniref:antitoxin Xre/MbcA/ParS toxin-binding domain-containing protein n=1 Tax=Rhodococcus sp. Q TaxID=2502252 RepID=UPI002016463D|nr:antitoxin Xre/MbcA/ParS toxin-binding domain-containing protein [Rhodococcus sp. Q]
MFDRLQVAPDAAHVITSAVAQAWLQGRNPALGDQPPAQLLREVNVDADRGAVLAAASEFATHSC